MIFGKCGWPQRGNKKAHFLLAGSPNWTKHFWNVVYSCWPTNTCQSTTKLRTLGQWHILWLRWKWAGSSNARGVMLKNGGICISVQLPRCIMAQAWEWVWWVLRDGSQGVVNAPECNPPLVKVHYCIFLQKLLYDLHGSDSRRIRAFGSLCG